MKKFLKYPLELVFIISLLMIGYWIYFYSGLDNVLINLIIINVFVYIIRTFLINFVNIIVKNRVSKFIFSLVLNLIWIVFLFILLFYISPTFSISIISFLIIAISLTFQDIISNIASGVLLISKEDIEVGDLVETNGIQGILTEINLNYTILKEFDGVLTYIPNKNVYNASVTKFTHRRIAIKDLSNDKKKIKNYARNFTKFISRGEKITNYTKIIEILPSLNPNELDSFLKPVFDKYETIFGIRPDYLVETTTWERCVLTLLIITKTPDLVLEFIDKFLRDLIFQLYPTTVFEGWIQDKTTESLKKSNEGEL